VTEAVTVPKLYRVVTRKAAIFNPVPNELSNNIWDHTYEGLPIGVSNQSAFPCRE
jgi:hypothetical protein